jgi:hypothetical protein
MNHIPAPEIIKPQFTSHPISGWVIARLLVLLLMLACVGMFIIGVFDFSKYAASHAADFIPYTPTWTAQIFTQILSQFGLSLHAWLQYKLVTSILIALVFWSIGFLIFFRKGKDWFGLYISALFVLFGTISGDPTTAFGGMHPEFTWLAPIGVIAWLGLFMLLFLFPNGRFVPRWTRWIALLLVLAFSVIFLEFGGSNNPPPPLILMVFALIGIGAGSQVHRYRRISTPVERQQTKWVMFTLVIVFLVLVFSLLPTLFPDSLTPGSSTNLFMIVLSSLPSYFLALIPLSVTFAILRYRLWDIDLIIRRTLQYGLLSVLLGMVYFGMVVLLEQVFRALTGQASPLAVVISTLVIAALFTPLRRRVQTAIDRRFFRAKYDADQAVASFAAAARNEVGLDSLTGHLAAAAQQSLQPEFVWVWIRKDVKHPDERKT